MSLRTQYGLYQESVQLCIKSNALDEEKWKRALFWVFDVPGIGHKPYEVEK
jgi:hypothetical protein